MYLPTAILFLLFLLIFFILRAEKRISLLRKAKHKAEKSVAIKSTMLDILSHEIRNPLTGFISVARLLDDTALDENQRTLVRTLNSSGEELLHLLDGTIEQARMDSDTFSIIDKSFYLHEIIEPLYTTFSCLAKDKGIMLTRKIPHSLNTVFLGDPNRIHQILFNLLANAIKFTASGIIKLQVEKFGEQNGKILLCFRVIDSGTGIPAEALQQIFEPYKQAHDIQRRFGGTGLGLCISRKLARMMGGDIKVETEEGRGSIFSMTLPLKTTGVSIQLSTAASQQDFSATHILKLMVVDDADIHRIAAGALLEAAGYKVVMAATASEAFSLLHWQQIDCVLLDLHLPDMDGIEAIHRMRQLFHSDKAQPHIIVVSAWLEATEIEQLLQAGARAVCRKPLDADTIRHVLDTLHEHSTSNLQNIRASLPPSRTSRIS